MKKIIFCIIMYIITCNVFGVETHLCVKDKVAYNFAPKIEGVDLEKPLVLVVCSYNNEEYCIGNLESILKQNYHNYRVIYVNDASTDSTGKLVQQFIAERGLEDSWKYIENEENKNAMYNQYNAVHSCRDDEIILILDGDDELYTENALKRVNQAYLDDRVWVTYGNWKSVRSFTSNNKPIAIKTLIDGKHRKHLFCWSHLRTFYAGLFKLIPKNRFTIKNKFIATGSDVPIMLNLIDLAREHTFYIPDIIYLYNVDNPINDCKVDVSAQSRIANWAYRRPQLPNRCFKKCDFIKGVN